jgi:hypothetical protein
MVTSRDNLNRFACWVPAGVASGICHTTPPGAFGPKIAKNPVWSGFL